MLQKEIKRLREAAGLTQKELADKLHITQHALSQYETGKRQMTIEMFENALKALKVNIKFHVEDKKMKQKVLALKFFEEWRSLEERFPEWRVDHTGGGFYLLTKNIKNRFGKEIAVSISKFGGIAYKKIEKDDTQPYGVKIYENELVSFEEWEKNIDLYFEYQDLCGLPLFDESEYGWTLSADMNLLFLEDEIDEMTYIASLL